MSLPAILAAARPTATGLLATIPEEWMQGRTSYGGLSSALALEAARTAADDLPPLRSATINFVGPLAGEVEVVTRVLRRGRNATWVSAEVTSEAGVGLTATFVFMGPVESSIHLHDAPPPVGADPGRRGGDPARAPWSRASPAISNGASPCRAPRKSCPN